MNRERLLAAEGIDRRFGKKAVLVGVSLELHRGEVVALVGENGAGKTTLLQVCAGLLRPDGGRVDRRARVGYCPQDPGLLDLLTAKEHLVYFGAALGMPRRAALTEGARLLAEFAFPHAEAGIARDLSGGNRQKLNLVLALLGGPDLLLLDEPYQGFDRGTYIDFWEHVGVWRAQGKAILVVTHVLAELGRADRIVELDVRR